MSQTIKVKEIRGPLGKGEKQFFAVVADDGTEFTTFDTKIQQVTKGSVLSIEPVVKGKYANIGKWELKEAGPALSGKQSSSDAQLQMELKRLELRSLEAREAFRGIVDLLTHGCQLEKEISDDALDWAHSRLIAKPARAAAPDEDWEKLGHGHEESEEPIKNVGDLLTRAYRIGISRTDVMSIASVQSTEELEGKDLDAIWEDVKHRAPKKE